MEYLVFEGILRPRPFQSNIFLAERLSRINIWAVGIQIYFLGLPKHQENNSVDLFEIC